MLNTKLNNMWLKHMEANNNVNTGVKALTDTWSAWSLSMGVCREEVWHIAGRGMITLPIGGKWESWEGQKLSVSLFKKRKRTDFSLWWNVRMQNALIQQKGFQSPLFRTLNEYCPARIDQLKLFAVIQCIVPEDEAASSRPTALHVKLIRKHRV